MASLPYKVSNAPRSANAVAKHDSKKLVSADGNRTAIGRMVKCAGPMRTYTIVEAWTLRERNAEGKLVIVRTGMGLEAAQKFVAG